MGTAVTLSKKSNNQLQMEQSLDAKGCEIVRDFFRWLLKYADVTDKIDISFILKQYRIYRNGQLMHRTVVKPMLTRKQKNKMTEVQE